MSLSRRTAISLAAAATTAGRAAAQPAPAGPWAKEGKIQRPGMSIHYVELGSGPPLVLLHKLGGWVSDWRHVAPALAQHYRVIALDSPGHGESTVEGPVPYILGLPESAATVLAVLDELGVGTFSMVGNSLGGCIAVCLAALWPARVRRLGLLSVALYPVIPRSALETLEPPGTWGPNGEPIARPFPDLQKRFGITDVSIYNEQVASRAKAGRWVRAAQRGVANAGVIDYLGHVQCPTLLMYGALGFDYQEYEKPGLAAAKRGRSVHIPAAGSFAQQDNPRATENIILDFLAEKDA